MSRIKHSICHWCHEKIGLESLCQLAVKLGYQGIDIVGSDAFPTLKKHNLIGSMTPTHSLTDGLCREENHQKCLTAIRNSIHATAQAGFPNVICFSGNANGMDRDQGRDNCLAAIKQVVGLAEKNNVTLCMELLNSKIDHPDYMCDHTAWGVELVKTVGSDHFKLLYDIYHMQVMEGDIIATIRANHQYIGHYHTAGVPGRNDIDDTQELNYPAIIKAIAATGYQGWLAQEFVPLADSASALAQAAKACRF